jgi:hypothetical protein
MFWNLILTATTSFFLATAAVAQTPAPPNINPGSLQSGAEESGAGNQPRSPGMNSHGTRTMDKRSTVGRGVSSETDGVNANVKPGSTRSGHSESGPAASSPR